jgi:hypothetical protein
MMDSLSVTCLLSAYAVCEITKSNRECLANIICDASLS